MTAQIYNEMHGLFVQLGKHYCTKRRPKCEVCPLGAMLPPPGDETLLRLSPDMCIAGKAKHRKVRSEIAGIMKPARNLPIALFAPGFECVRGLR